MGLHTKPPASFDVSCPEGGETPRSSDVFLSYVSDTPETALFRVESLPIPYPYVSTLLFPKGCAGVGPRPSKQTRGPRGPNSGNPLSLTDAEKRIVKERIKRRVVRDSETGCWIWRNSAGEPVAYALHRKSFAAYNGDIPSGRVIAHECDNPYCVNPEHLSAKTQAENMRDKGLRGRARDGSPGRPALCVDPTMPEYFRRPKPWYFQEVPTHSSGRPDVTSQRPDVSGSPSMPVETAFLIESPPTPQPFP